MLSYIVEVFMHFWTELRGVKRVTVRGDITVFRGSFKFDNFYFIYHIEANQVNFSPFSRFEFRTLGVHRSVPPIVHLGTVKTGIPVLSLCITYTLFGRLPNTSDRKKTKGF